MSNQCQNPFKWRHFQPDIIVHSVRWYWRSSLSSRDLEEVMLERGLHMDQTTISRWVQSSAPDLKQCCHPQVKPTTNSQRVDETSVQVKKQWVYLSCAVDSQGNTLKNLLIAP